MVNVRVPLVNIQTPQMITIRIAVLSEPVASTTPFLATTKFRILGAAQGITKFSKTNTRDISKIRGFNGNEYEPAYVVPGEVSSSLTLDRIVFHDSDALSMLGFTRGNVLYQDNPFVIIEDQYALSSGGLFKKEPSVTLARSLYYNDCWITDSPITYDIQSNDLILIPTIKVECGKIVSSEELALTIASDVANVVIKGVRLITDSWR
jgi:hypothetical protein